MKKILLSAVALLGLTAATAQIYTANDSAAFSMWTAIDLDGDGNNWVATDVSWLTNTQTGQGGCAVSNSWAGSPLTPDNLFTSPVIDLTGTVGATLEFSVGNPETTASGWYEEHYAVYVTDDAAAFAAAAAGGTFPTPELETTLTAGDTMFTETIDLTAFAGQTDVYVIFRHFNCTDENFIILDDLTITGDFASINENSLEVLSAYPNPATDVLNIKLNNNASQVSIISLDGKVVYTESVNTNILALNVADLTAGIYFYEVVTAEGEKITNKFVKK